MQSIHWEINSNTDFIDTNFYSNNKYNKNRSDDLRRCHHPTWSKTCQHCKRIISSEISDKEHNQVEEFQKEIQNYQTLVRQLTQINLILKIQHLKQ